MALHNCFCKKQMVRRHFSLLFTALLQKTPKNFQMFWKGIKNQCLEGETNIWQPGTTLCCDITKG